MRKGLVIGCCVCLVKCLISQWDIENPSKWGENIELPIIATKDINEVDPQSLYSIELLTESEIRAITIHRKTFGLFSDWIELQQCGIPPAKIRELRNSFYLREETGWNSFLVLMKKHRWVPQTHTQISLKNDPLFPGISFMGKSSFSWGNHLKVKALAHSDASERSIDHSAFCIEVKNTPYFDKVLMGKQSIFFGQGLTHNAPFAVGRSLNIGTWVHDEMQIRSQVSPNEDMGNWGITLKSSKKRLSYIIGMGYDFWDTRLTENHDAFTSRITGGLHRSRSEIKSAKNNRINYGTLGFNHNFQSTKISGIVTYQGMNSPKEGHSTVLWNYEFQWSGNVGTNRFLTNIAATHQNKYAWYFAWIKSLGSNLDIGIKGKYIQKDYYAPMRSVYDQYDYGKKGLEFAIDGQLSKRHQWKIRKSLLVKYPRNISDEQASPSWILYTRHELSRVHQISTQTRWQGQGTSQRIKFQYQLKINPNQRLKLEYQTNNEAPYTHYFILCSWRRVLPIGTVIVYATDYSSNSPFYSSLPSAEFAWQLGTFSGSGNGWGTVLRLKLSQKWRLLFSASFNKKGQSVSSNENIPRIFVSLKKKG